MLSDYQVNQIATMTQLTPAQVRAVEEAIRVVQDAARYHDHRAEERYKRGDYDI
jgi:hypothetical protein